MCAPKYVDYHFEYDGDLTDYCHELKQSELVAGVCPICGSHDITFVDSDREDFDTIIEGYVCNECGSEFSFTYWVTAIYVRSDARFDKED